mgnify:FL=1
MDKVDLYIEKISNEKNISLEDIPQIDLYMDQVIQLFENKYGNTKRNAEEKILTKTMINNYAKGKLIFPIKNKKYSKEHLIMISFIYQMKGALSIKDIHDTLNGINNKMGDGQFPLEAFYDSYLQLNEKNKRTFMEDVQEKKNDVMKQLQEEDKELTDDLEKIMLITSLASVSNMYRRAAEALVDDLKDKENK